MVWIATQLGRECKIKGIDGSQSIPQKIDDI